MPLLSKSSAFEAGFCKNCRKFKLIDRNLRCYPEESRLQCPQAHNLFKGWTIGQPKNNKQFILKKQTALF